jgi:hypothetical protein
MRAEMKSNNKHDNDTLDYEEIEKFEVLTLAPGIVDAVIAAGFQFFFIVLIGVFRPPIFRVIETNFMFTIALFCLFIIPILLISIIDIVNNYKIIKNKNKEKKIEDYRFISALSFYIIPLLFLIYLPSNILEFYLWIITAFALYLGFGKFPLIKYSIEVFHLPNKNLYFNRKVIRNIIPSMYSLSMTMWIILFVICLRIYPIPFLLLIFCIKYIIQRKYFHDLSSEEFYENWYRAERFLKKWLEYELIIISFIVGIFYALALLDYY